MSEQYDFLTTGIVIGALLGASGIFLWTRPRRTETTEEQTMTRKNITEWQCNRCGTEAAIDTSAVTGWFHLSAPHSANSNHYQGTKHMKMGGDLCPDCTKSLWNWWIQPRQPALQDA